jgi:hypothetical protein
MGHALQIFRKDVRHLWPRIAIVLAVCFLSAWATYWPVAGAWTTRNILGLPSLLAWWYLMAAVIHEEALPGNRQYWLTRPFSRWDLLAAKAIFVLVFVCLPDFCTEVTVLVLRGKSPLGYLPDLLICQLFGLAKVFLPAAALASITTGLVEFAWTGLAALAGAWIVGIPLAFRFLPQSELFWGGGLDWFRATAVAALLLAASAAILLVQYVRRQTWLSRGILAAALPISVFLTWMPGWHTAFALQCRLSGQPVADTVASIAFDPARDTRTRPDGKVMRPGQSVHGIAIPVRVTGIPEGMALCSERATVTADAPAHARWSSGWDSLNSLWLGRGQAGMETERFLPGDGEYWLYLNIHSSFYGRAGSRPLHLHARLALTLLSPEQVSPLTLREGAQAANDGFCWVTARNGQVESSCSWPVRTPARLGLRLRSGGTNLPLTSWGGELVGSYGPYPTSGGLWQWADRNGSMDPPLAGIELVTQRAVAHFERELDIPALGNWINQ